MREIKDHHTPAIVNENASIRIEAAVDENPKTGAVHKYQFFLHKNNEWSKSSRIEFHDPTVPSVPGEGPNGVTPESVLAIVLDHLQGLQTKASSRERSLAVTKLQESLFWLQGQARRQFS